MAETAQHPSGPAGKKDMWRRPGVQPELLRAHEVAAVLGISRSLAYQWMAAGVLPVMLMPGVRRGKRVPRAALMRWVEERTLAVRK